MSTVSIVPNCQTKTKKIMNETHNDQKSSNYNHGLGLKVSNKNSMAVWAMQQINNNQSFDDFVPVLKNWMTIDDIKQIVINKIQNAHSNSQIFLMRSLFVKIAPIYDILPNDVLVKILKYLYCDKNWICFPLISKSFKNIMYLNGSTLYNNYTIKTHDDGVPFILENENDILKLHISHSKRIGNIQFCPLLTDSINKYANGNSKNIIHDSLVSTSEQWKSLVKDIRYDKKSLVTFDTSDHNKSHVKDDHLNIDNCHFPWHLIRKWEIKCYDSGLTWKTDLIMLDNAFENKIDIFKREFESIQQQTQQQNVKIISIQEEKSQHDHKTQETSKNNINNTNKLRMRQSGTDSTDLSDSDETDNQEFGEKTQLLREFAALQLQTFYRGYCQRKQFKNQIVKIKKATSIIWQSYLYWDRRNGLKQWLDDKVEKTRYKNKYPLYYSNYNHVKQLEEEKRRRDAADERMRQLEMEREERRKRMRGEQPSLRRRQDEMEAERRRLEEERAARNLSIRLHKHGFKHIEMKLNDKKRKKCQRMTQRGEIMKKWTQNVDNWLKNNSIDNVDQDFDNIVHFGNFHKKGSDRLIKMLHKASDNIRYLTLNNFPCFNYDIYDRLKNEYPQFDKIFYLQFKNISCDYDVGYGINEIILKNKINVMNLEILELCNINCSIEYKYNKSKTFKQCLRKMFSTIPEFKNLNGIEHDNIIDEFKQWYSTRVGDGESSKSLQDIRNRYFKYQSYQYKYVQMDDFLQDMIDSWLYYKSKLLFYQKMLDTLSDIANKNNQSGLNLKVLKLDCDELNKRDESLFFQLYYPQFWNFENDNNDHNNNENELNKILKKYKPEYDGMSYFIKYKKYLDAGNVILTIPKCSNLEILSLNNLICKINVCNIINQTSNPILIFLQNIIAHQLINNSINNNNNDNYNITTTNISQTMEHKTEDTVPLICDCLLIENNKNLKHFQTYWKYFIQFKSNDINHDSWNNNNKNNTGAKFEDTLLLSRFVHVNNTYQSKSEIDQEDILKKNFPEIFEKVKSKKQTRKSTSVIDGFMNIKQLRESNVYFVELNSNLDNLLYHLIKCRYFVNEWNDNNSVNTMSKDVINNNPIWFKYIKWFNMGILKWVKDIDAGIVENDKSEEDEEERRRRHRRESNDRRGWVPQPSPRRQRRCQRRRNRRKRSSDSESDYSSDSSDTSTSSD